MDNKKSKKLESNTKKIKSYNRPEVTVTDIMQNNEEVMKQLKGFVEIKLKDLETLPRYTYIKYLTFSFKTNKEMFRFGGKLLVNKDKYVVLKGINCTFCVQKHLYSNGELIYNTRFFKKKIDSKNKEAFGLKKELSETIDKANNMYLKQTMIIKGQKEKINKLKRKIIKIKNKN